MAWLDKKVGVFSAQTALVFLFLNSSEKPIDFLFFCAIMVCVP
jgi:hypothetical protein